MGSERICSLFSIDKKNLFTNYGFTNKFVYLNFTCYLLNVPMQYSLCHLGIMLSVTPKWKSSVLIL